jgi:hypothetical protein
MILNFDYVANIEGRRGAEPSISWHLPQDSEEPIETSAEVTCIFVKR